MPLETIEEKISSPFGSGKEVQSDSQLIAGTHRDMQQRVIEGRFCENFYARINMWNLALSDLAQRQEDIALDVEYELYRFSSSKQIQIRFDKEARTCYLTFAYPPQTQWCSNPREPSSPIA